MIELLQAGKWEQLLFGEHGLSFIWEILFRTFVMYLVILFGLRIIGKRGVRQLSIFELVVIIGLGSSAGDPMFYKEVGLVSAMAVFLVVIASYRLTTFLTAKSTRFEEIVEGKTVCLIEDGKFCYNSFDKEDVAQDEFFAELRLKGVSQLGQVERGYLETSGAVSLFLFPEDKVKPGLPMLLHEFCEQLEVIPSDALYACAYCAETYTLKKGQTKECHTCKNSKWVKAVDRVRVN